MSYEPHEPMPHIDKLLLIKLVSERPVLWDLTSDSYKSHDLKKKAWHEVGALIRNDFTTLTGTEKQKYYMAIIKTWRHIRDTWRRSLNARANAKKRGITIRPYKYHREMLFLKKLPTIPARRLASSLEPPDIDDEEEETVVIEDSEPEPVCKFECEEEWDYDSKEENVSYKNQEISTTSRQETMKKVDVIYEPDDTNDVNKAYIDNRIIQMTNQYDTQQDDRHFAFFKSIHPTLTLFNDDQILDFQSGVINLLRSIKRGGMMNSFSNEQSGPRVIQISSSSVEAGRSGPKMTLDPLN